MRKKERDILGVTLEAVKICGGSFVCLEVKEIEQAEDGVLEIKL